MPATKRQKKFKVKSAGNEEPADRNFEENSDEDQSNSGLERGSDGQSTSEDEDDSTLDTDDEIAGARVAKSKKTLKRKRRATEPSRFGATLQGLLSTDAPSSLPLSLKPSVARKRNDEKLEMKAKKVLQVEKREKEDKARIKDVIGGWGGESERALRKVAQRGVVKLFNVIQQSQVAASAAVEESKASRGTGKPTLPAPSLDKSKANRKGKNKDNLIGRGKESGVNKDEFFDMIRSGGIVSKIVNDKAIFSLTLLMAHTYSTEER